MHVAVAPARHVRAAGGPLCPAEGQCRLAEPCGGTRIARLSRACPRDLVPVRLCMGGGA